MVRHADPKRREAILRAARDVLLEQGYAETRLADIARKAGVAVGTLYLYFDSKEAMVRQLAIRMRRIIIVAVLPVLEHFTGQEDVAKIVKTVLALDEQHGDLLRILRLDAGLSISHPGPKGPPQGPIVQEFVQLLTAKMDQGAIRRYEPLILAQLLLGFFEWVLETSPLMGEQDMEHYEENLVQWLGRALLP
ncbi:MAG TPA: helix-turn-helix domain-containing protein [Ktedonobacteraceae bacterium]|nr:helix-turn-helix domain-containing protein [Ktedonobacteraceae bacterium]